MNRPGRTIVSALIASVVCVGLIALPNVLTLFSDGAIEHNQRLRLVWFLSLALPGLGISLVLSLWAKRKMKKHAVNIAWYSATILAVALPAPAILSGDWGDGLIPWYLCFAAITGGLWGWSSELRTE